LGWVHSGLTFISILFKGSLETNFLAYLMLFVRAEVNEDTLFLGLNKRVSCLGNALNSVSLFLRVLLELLVDDQTIGREFLPLFHNNYIPNFQVLPKVKSERTFPPNSRFLLFGKRVVVAWPEILPDHGEVELVRDLLFPHVNADLDGYPTD
jgi:hypothetical protein